MKGNFQFLSNLIFSIIPLFFVLIQGFTSKQNISNDLTEIFLSEEFSKQNKSS